MKVKDFYARFDQTNSDCSLIVEDVTGQRWTLVERLDDGPYRTNIYLDWADDLMDRLVQQIVVKNGEITLRLKPLRRRRITE